MKTTKILVGVLTISLSMVLNLNGQTGPGGIGEKYGETVLILWLDAAEGVTTNENDRLTSWNDLSGYSNHALGNDNDNQPALLSDAINGLPVVKFDGYNDRLRIPGHISLQPDNMTIIAVVKRTGVSGWGDIISRPYSTSWNSPYTSYALCTCNAHSMGYDGPYPFSQVAAGAGVQVVNWNPPHGIIPNNQPYIHALAYNYHGNGMGSFLNNGLRGADDIAIKPATGNLDYNNLTLDVSIGTRSEYNPFPYSDHYLDGEIAEIVMFNYDLTEVEHIIVANYLATKYNIAIGWDQFSEIAGFTNSPIGLGREDHEEEQHLLSEGGNLTMSCSGFSQNTSYIFAAHNNGTMQGTPITQPIGYNNRLNRIWYLETRGTRPETISLTFTLPINPSNNRNHYGLLFSENQDFISPTQILIANTVNVEAKTITFVVNSETISNGFYTLGSKINHWYGMNNEWTDITNWDGQLPEASTDVVITGSCNYYPILTQDVPCGSIEIQSGGSLNIDNSSLEVYKNFSFSGMLFNSGESGTLHFKGSSTSSIWAGSASLGNVISEKTSARLEILEPITITGNFSILSGTLDAVGGLCTLGGNLTIAESVTTITPGLTIICNGNGNQLLSADLSIAALIVDHESAQVDISNADILSANIFIQDGKLIVGNNTLRNISITEAGTLELTGTVNISGSVENNSGMLIHNEQKTVFSQNMDQVLTSDGLVFFDVEINKSGRILQITDQLTLAGDLAIVSGGFLHNNNQILFTGSVNQLLTTNGTNLFNVEIDKPGGFVEMNDHLVITNDLTILSGSLHTGIHQLTVNGNLSNTSGTEGLIITGNENGTGSVIHFSPNVPATTGRYIEAADWETGSDGWHFVSAPSVGQNISGDWSPSGFGNDYDFFAWDETNGQWLNQKLPENDITAFSSGLGYLVAYQQTDVKSFVGNLHSGNINITLQNSNSGEYSGWNLLGNPYPSAIDWNWADKSLLEDDFAYIYNTQKAGGAGFEAIDGGSEDAFIPVAQGFFVQAKETSHNQNFTFTNGIRRHGGNFYKEKSDKHLIKLKLSNGEHHDETVLRIQPESAGTHDRRDALKLFSYNLQVPQIYSLTNEGCQVSVNTFPFAGDTIEVHLSLRNQTTQTLTLSISEINGLFLDQSLFLVDKQTNTVHPFSDESNYTFLFNVDENPNRFLLKFSPVGIEESPENELMQIYSCGKTLTILNPDNLHGTIQIFNIPGRQVLERAIKGEASLSIETCLSAGIYIVNVISSEGITKKKIIIR